MHVIIGEHLYSLQPTAQAVSRVENELQESLIGLARRLAAGDMRLDEMALLFFHFIYANHADASPTLDQIRQDIVENGLWHGLEALSELFSHLIDAHDEVGESGLSIKAQLGNLATRFPDSLSSGS